MKVKVSNSNQPNWKVVSVKSHIPAALKKLDEMAHNLWWTWNVEGIENCSVRWIKIPWNCSAV